MKARESHYVLVHLTWPTAVSTDSAADMVEAAIQQAKDNEGFRGMHGNGPKPPYEFDLESFSVYPDERP